MLCRQPHRIAMVRGASAYLFAGHFVAELVVVVPPLARKLCKRISKAGAGGKDPR